MSKKECDFCSKEANSLCFECILYFCDEHFKMSHSSEKNKNHKQELIDLYLPLNLKCQNHPKIPFNYFCIEKKEFCWSECLYKNKHKDHKLIRIEDEESLRKEIITIDFYQKDNEEIKNKIMDIKDKIKKEQDELDKIYEDIKNKIKNNYEKKMEELLKEENNLIDKLNNEITKVKENLYNNFRKITDEIKINERINKYMKMMGQKEKNIFKKLTIISNMEKNIKEMKKINNDKIKSIKIKYLENK